MTEVLCASDSYLKSFRATVTDVGPLGVELDRTAFYPGGGGQMCDRGELRAAGRTYAVKEIKRDAGRLWHVIDDIGGLAAGDEVEGAIDWGFRYKMMRTHTALHILCGVIWQDFGVQVTGGQMYPDRARMDFALADLSPERVKTIEERANQAVREAHEVRVDFLPREEAFKIPDLIRTKINLLPPGIQTVRTIDIVGVDLQADGGTHVANTREVGAIRIVKTENKGRENKRIEIAVD